ncbi:MAG: hypothetical protein JXR71_12990 [Bacteroidales bacterium]|nr:hypothetical protein [Bacteroidales bacterium]
MSDYLVDIPEQFYSDGDGKPFETCVVCGRNLMEDGTRYVIEKAMKNYEGYDFSATVFEYAMCLDCYQEMQKGMSEESMQNLQQYQMRLVQEKSADGVIAIDLSDFSLSDWLSKCFFKDKPVSEMKEYQLIGQFEGNHMIMNMPPMAIGEEVMEEMSELLSEQTKGEMDRFRRDFLGPSPEIEELIYGRKLIFL